MPQNNQLIPLETLKTISFFIFFIGSLIIAFLLFENCFIVKNFLFIIVSIIWASLYGVFAFEIHAIDNRGVGNNFHFISQVFFNYAGALIGWIALYFLIQLPWNNPQDFGWQHLILAYISFIGMSGRLPYIVTLRNPFSN